MSDGIDGAGNPTGAIAAAVVVAIGGGLYLAYRSLCPDRIDELHDRVQQATGSSIGDAQSQAQAEVKKRAEGQREKAIRVVKEVADSGGRLTCAAVMAPGGQWFYDLFGDRFAATVGDYFDSIRHLLAMMPTDKNLRTVMEGETKYFQEQGFWQLGGWLSADARMSIILSERAKWLKTLTTEETEAFNKAQESSG